MNKYNILGIELINYKQEIMKDYPEIVKRSLYLSIDQLMQNNIIDVDTHYSLKDDGTLMEDFKSLILTKPAYVKTAEELFVEYEVLREKINAQLEVNNLAGSVHTQSYVDKEKISVSKTFLIGEEEVVRYFGVPREDLEKLMKRKGFVEKYAVLRLPKILGDFLKTIDYPVELFKCSASLVYYDMDKNSYCIDLIFDAPVNVVEDDKNITDIVLNIKDIIENSISFYNSKTME